LCCIRTSISSAQNNGYFTSKGQQGSSRITINQFFG
jgi:hypothetical protein